MLRFGSRRSLPPAAAVMTLMLSATILASEAQTADQTVVAFDVTASFLYTEHAKRAFLRGIVPTLRPGDSVTILRVWKRSGSDIVSRIATVRVAEKRGIDAIAYKSSLRRIRRAVESVRPSREEGTDVVGALGLASRCLGVPVSGAPRLFLFSDMKDDRLASRGGRLPPVNLRGVRVVVADFTGEEEPGRGDGLRVTWANYFANAGARSITFLSPARVDADGLR